MNKAEQTATNLTGSYFEKSESAVPVEQRAPEAGTKGGYGEVLRIAIPLILSTASLTLMLFVSRMLLSWYGASSVAAATPGGITFFTICSFFIGTAEYVNTLVAQHHGAGDKPACARAVWQGLFFAVLVRAFYSCVHTARSSGADMGWS